MKCNRTLLPYIFISIVGFLFSIITGCGKEDVDNRIITDPPCHPLKIKAGTHTEDMTFSELLTNSGSTQPVFRGYKLEVPPDGGEIELELSNFVVQDKFPAYLDVCVNGSWKVLRYNQETPLQYSDIGLRIQAKNILINNNKCVLLTLQFDEENEEAESTHVLSIGGIPLSYYADIWITRML